MDIGDKFPDFTLPRDGGSEVSLRDYKGKKLVLFIYPKDDTPGCTTESIAFTAALSDFDAENTAIVGLSKDTVAKHEKFIQKHDLGVPLLSDETGELIEKLGCWVEKNNYGKKYMGIERTTFLIDETGKVAQVWRKVRVKDHVAKVLDEVKSLSA